MELNTVVSPLTLNTKYRRDVMRALLIIICLGGFSFFCINIYREIYSLAVLELTYVVYSLFLLRIINKTPNFHNWALAFVIPLFSLILYALTLDATSNSVFVWILACPIISYLLLGRKIGFVLSVIFITVGLIIYCLRFINIGEPINIAEAFNIIFSSALMISFSHVYEKNRELNENRLLELAGTDSLTGIDNRLKFYENFTPWANNSTNKKTLSIALLDLDFFKKINDDYGHNVGDKALCHSVNIINQYKPDNMAFARVGGEEFALKAVGLSNQEFNHEINKLRIILSETPLMVKEAQINITFSAGISSYGQDGITLDELLANADKRLYVAKKNGRNCIVSCDD